MGLLLLFFNFCVSKLLKRGECAAPMLVQPISHCSYSARIDVVDAPGSFSDFSNQSRFLKHLEVLRHGRAAYRQAAREITYRPRPVGEALKDLASRRVTERR